MSLIHRRASARLKFAMLLASMTTALAVVPSEYTLTDITPWSPTELGGLPYFDHYVPLPPTGASADFVPIARNGLGLVVGIRDFTTERVQGRGAYVLGGTQTEISAWLLSNYSYYYAYTSWNGMLINGFVTHSPVADVNLSGMVVGYASRPGSGTSEGGYSDHAWLRDTITASHTDITPDATRAKATAINDHGQIVGAWSNAQGGHPFIRQPDGSTEEFILLGAPDDYSLMPKVITNARLVAGDANAYSLPRDQPPWVCETGNEASLLPLPTQNSPDVGTITDANDHGMLVGEAHKRAAPEETSGVRWFSSDGVWTAEDLNEVLVDNLGFIVDSAVAVNDAGHILCSGHLDGGATTNTHRLLLAPVEPMPPAVATMSASAIRATSATLHAKLNPAGSTTSSSFEYGNDASYGSTLLLAPVDGTTSVLASAELTGLTPHTTYHFRIIGTNSAGVSSGSDTVITTPWDWATWASSHGAGLPEDDANHNGIPDLVDYATAGLPQVAVVSIKSGLARFSFTHSRVAVGVSLLVQLSDDLETWYPGPEYNYQSSSGSTADATELARIAVDAETERITISTPHRFARLRAATP